MSVFRYRARTNQGEVVTGQLAATSQQDLEKILNEKGLLLVGADVKIGGRLPKLLGVAVSAEAMLAFIREFKTLLGAGLPVAQTLKLLSDRPKQPKLSAAVRSMHQGILRGQSLADAAAEQQGVFDNLFQVTLRVGVQTGNLGQALERYSDFLVLRNELRRKLRKALTYPVFLLGLLAAVLIGLFLFVLPRFSELYSEFGSELPFATRVLMGAVDATPIVLVVAVCALAVSGIVFRRWTAGPAGRVAVDSLKLSLPIIGPILRNMAQIQLCYLLSMLMSAGISVREALRFAAQSAGNVVFTQGLERAGITVSIGKSVTEALTQEQLLPGTSLSLVKAGEASGSLDSMFEEISKLHEQILEDRMERVLALIEPMMMLLVGVVLGTVIIVVYLPIFGIADVIQ